MGNRVLLAVALFFFIATSAYANTTYIIDSDGLIGERTKIKINELGLELQNKTGVNLYALVNKDLGNATIEEYIATNTKDLNEPYVVLLVVMENKIIDILTSSEELEVYFNKKATLSPFPQKGGTVLPLLSDKRETSDKYSAAILNGYADLSDQISKSFNSQLDSSIGSANKSTLNFFRYLIFGFLIFVGCVYFYRRLKRV